MKTYHFILGAGLAATAYGVACPFEEMKRIGLLSKEDIAKFEAVKRDPKAAETLIRAHRREAEPEPEPQAIGGNIGPLVNGLLDLPYGGGLGKFPM